MVPIPGRNDGSRRNYPSWATTEPALVPVAINCTFFRAWDALNRAAL